MALGAIEMASAIGALYVLVPERAITSFPAFSTLYIGAVLLGIASHAPGGIGVFEAGMLALSNGENRAGILAALLFYRLIYNLNPFILACLVIAGDEMRAAFSSRGDSA
jgi:phosphatidylglycerol lysyltransferase